MSENKGRVCATCYHLGAPHGPCNGCWSESDWASPESQQRFTRSEVIKIVEECVDEDRSDGNESSKENAIRIMNRTLEAHSHDPSKFAR